MLTELKTKESIARSLDSGFAKLICAIRSFHVLLLGFAATSDPGKLDSVVGRSINMLDYEIWRKFVIGSLFFQSCMERLCHREHLLGKVAPPRDTNLLCCGQSETSPFHWIEFRS